MTFRASRSVLPLLLVLAACGTVPTPTTTPSSSVPEFVTAEGFVRPVQVRVYEMGTHTLVSRSGETLYFLASSVVDLGAHVGEEVEVRGITTSLGSGSDLLLAVRELRTISGAATGDEAIDAAKRLARDFDPPYAFLASDPSEVLSASAVSGITVVRIQQEQGAYLVKLVRRPDPVTGEWEIFAIEREAPVASSVPSSTPEESSIPSSTPPSSTPPSAPAAKGDNATVTALVDALPGLLSGSAFPDTYRASKVEITSKKQAYISFSRSAGDAGIYEAGMLLVGWTMSPASATVLASFIPGDTSDWKKLSGDNVARSEAVTIYAPKSGAWIEQATTQEGFALYANAGLKFTMQYPKQWYYATLPKSEGGVARLGFSNTPVTVENTLVTVEVVSSPASTYATKLTPTTIGGKVAYQGTLNVGTQTIVIARDANSAFVLTASPDGAGQLAAMAATIVW